MRLLLGMEGVFSTIVGNCILGRGSQIMLFLLNRISGLRLNEKQVYKIVIEIFFYLEYIGKWEI